MNDQSHELDTLQRWMQEALIAPDRTSPEEIAQIVAGSPRQLPAERLAIYQRSYYARILGCLEEQFPALCFALGKELFRDFGREYLQSCPSQSYTLYDLGRRFTEYLQQTRPDSELPEEKRESWIDFMVDLAHFERKIFVMFDAQGHEGKPFAVWETPDEHLRLQPCFELGDYRFPVGWYYHEVRQKNSPQHPSPRRSCLALLRRDYLTSTIPLTLPHYTFLKAMSSGASVAESLQVVASELKTPVTDVLNSWNAPRGLRQRWLDAGFFEEMP